MKFKFKQLVAVAVAMLVAVWPAAASDLTRGITFTDGQRLTASQLHQLIDNTSISAQFYTSQSAETTLPTGDYFLVYSPTLLGYRKMTASTALYGNTAFITSQTEKTTPATNDYVLLYDTAGTVLKKASLYNISLGTTNLINGQPAVTNLSSTALLLVLNNGTNASISASNLFWSLETWNKPFTNLLTHTAPTNEDRLVIWDSVAGTNKTTTLAGLITNLPAASAATNTDVFFGLRAGTGVLQQFTMSQLLTLVSNYVVYPSLTNNTTTVQLPIPATGTAVTNTHSLGVMPTAVRWVLVCTNTSVGYIAGTEVDLAGANTVGHTEAPLSLWISATNYGVVRSSLSGALALPKRTATIGSSADITEANWNIKGYFSP